MAMLTYFIEILSTIIGKVQLFDVHRPPSDLLGGQRPLQGTHVVPWVTIDPRSASGRLKVAFS